MAISINNNYAAAIAVQNLSATGAQLDVAQKRISTGRRVDSAQDDAATYAIAEISKSEVTRQKAVQGVISQGISLLSVTQDAGKKVMDALNRMLEKATAAQSSTLTTAQRAALNAEFQQARDEITTIVENANFNGTNLLKRPFIPDNAQPPANTYSETVAYDGVSILIDANGNTLDIDKRVLDNSNAVTSDTTVKLDLESLGLVETPAVAAGQNNNPPAVAAIPFDLLNATNVNASLTKVRDAIAEAAEKLGRIGAWATRLENTAGFTKALIDANNKAISNLVDADLAEESARLQSLQIKQQLGTQALSIANSAPQMLLSLFRG